MNATTMTMDTPSSEIQQTIQFIRSKLEGLNQQKAKLEQALSVLLELEPDSSVPSTVNGSANGAVAFTSEPDLETAEPESETLVLNHKSETKSAAKSTSKSKPKAAKAKQPAKGKTSRFPKEFDLRGQLKVAYRTAYDDLDSAIVAGLQALEEPQDITTLVGTLYGKTLQTELRKLAIPALGQYLSRNEKKGLWEIYQSEENPDVDLYAISTAAA